eukprot:m.186657 g.186657  ORF g.186657 m.186657 type:complete len:140 (+) comp18491_c1_seq103:4488-4907(+)
MYLHAGAHSIPQSLHWSAFPKNIEAADEYSLTTRLWASLPSRSPQVNRDTSVTHYNDRRVTNTRDPDANDWYHFTLLYANQSKNSRIGGSGPNCAPQYTRRPALPLVPHASCTSTSMPVPPPAPAGADGASSTPHRGRG